MTIETDDHDHHHYHGRHGHGDKWERYIAGEQAAGFREAVAARERYGAETAAQHTTTVRDVKDTRFDLAGVSRDGFQAVALGQCKTDDRVGDGFGSLSRELCGGFGAGIAATVAAAREAGVSFSDAQKQISDSATSTLVGFKDLTALSYQIEGRGLLEAAKNANSLSVQATSYANAASVEATKNFYALSLENTKNAAAQLAASERCCCELKEKIAASTAAAEMTARMLAAEAAKQAAECCCELKALIAGQRTADLEDRLRNADLDARFARISVSVGGVATAAAVR